MVLHFQLGTCAFGFFERILITRSYDRCPDGSISLPEIDGNFQSLLPLDQKKHKGNIGLTSI